MSLVGKISKREWKSIWGAGVGHSIKVSNCLKSALHICIPSPSNLPQLAELAQSPSNPYTMAAFRGLSSFVLGYLAVSVLANPVPEAEPDPNPLSLPPLIPSVPGFTDPIGTLAPPLPVLQVPTPAKPSPPFTGSDIKPKKIGYFWTAAGDNDHAGKWNKLYGRAEANSPDRFPGGL